MGDKGADMRRSGLESLWQRKHGAAEATALPLGRFLPCDSPVLSLPVADEWARRNGLPSLDDFLSLFQSNIQKPVKPSPDMLDDTLHRFPPDNPAHAKFFRHALEREELDRYFHNFRAYEAKTQEAERHCAAYSPDAAGYLKFLAEKDETLSRFFFESYRTLPIEEADRERHTYIVGGSGSGKTELIKVLLHHYLARNTAPALVVIDPHGDLSRQVARWPEFSDNDRLVYIAPGFGKGVSPVFNPFDIPDSERTEEAVSVLVDDTIDIVQELLEKDFTTNMGTLLQACFTILFYRPGSTFSDVLRFVDKKNNHDLLEVGERVFRADNPLLQFIRHDLASDSLGPTRQAVKMRFTQILSRHFFRSFLIGQRSTFRLEELLRQRKAVIFNLSKSDIGTRESRIFGKFIIAHLRAFAFKQGRLPEEARVHVHVFVDECQDFITDSIEIILTQARKFRVYLTLVQQSIGKGMSRELLGDVLTNTAIKITGRNSEANRRVFEAETKVPPQDLERLERGAGLFCIHTSSCPSVVVKIPGHRLKDRKAVPDKAWEARLAEQTALYYAPRDSFSPALAELTPTDRARLAAPAGGPESPIDY